MFGIGMPELILILAVALIVIGPKKLPDLAKSLGKAMGEFKKATNDIKDSMQLDSGIQEVKTSFKDLEKELKQPVETIKSSTSDVDEDASEAVDGATGTDADEAEAADTLIADEPGDDAPPGSAPGPDAPEPEASEPYVSDADDANTPRT